MWTNGLHFEFSVFSNLWWVVGGGPSTDINNGIIQRALTRMTPVWGKRRTHLIPPQIDTSDPVHPALPSTELTAWITCNEPIEQSFMGSEFVLVWYLDDQEFESSTIREVATSALKAIDWKDVAEDFDW